MTFRYRYQPLTTQLTLTMLALAAFSLATVIGFVIFATLSADGESLERQKTLANHGIHEEISDVVRQQRSIAVWDDAIINARSGDQTWLAENLGEWMYSYYGHDRAYLFDSADRPVHAMQDGKTVAPAAYGAESAIISPFIARLRSMLVEAPAGSEPPVVADLATLDGKPAIVSVQPLTPSSDRLTQPSGSEFVHVSVQFLDDELVGRIAEQFMLAKAHILPQLTARVADASIPLMASNGVIVGYLVWEQDRPGMTLIAKASPALIIGGLIAAGVLYFLMMRLRAATGDLQRTKEEAQYLAGHDKLTGLPNRALFENRLNHALLAIRRDNRRVALLYIDLDRFKNVNDTLGHAAGDELVRQTAGRLKASVRQVDTVARLGGDEFAVIVFDIKDLDACEELCGRLLAEIEKPFAIHGNQAYVGASIGVSISLGVDTDAQELLRKADIALYEAKKNGRGRYAVFAGDMDDLLAHKRVIETDLRAALASGGQLSLLYQPIFAPDGVALLGAEALVRWDHPVHGDLPPAQFITIAEDRGIIGQLGDWVLHEAVAFALSCDVPWVAVNLSPLQLLDAKFPAHLLGILRKAGLPPERLQLEFTESVLIEISDTTRSVLASLRAAGIRVALDDFGTGHSSINYLRRKVIDKLKIDRSLVGLLGKTEGSTAIIKALVDLANAMDVEVTAEGVETAAQRDILVDMACDEMQGYLLSPPLSAAAMRDLAEEHVFGPRLQVASNA